ncbi:MAG: outer membrane beta-barrel domain-containing protein [Bdellovibrionales bacterium]
MRAQNTASFGNIVTSLLLAGSFTLPVSAFAQSKAKPAAAPVPAEKAKEGQVDISDIENKYWAPKDTDFNVVQNRTYTKEKRFAVSAQFGPVINETLNDGNGASLGVNYYFNERWGLQLNYTMLKLGNSDATQAFIDAGGGPNYGRVTGYYDIGLNWVPFYAKMSVVGKKIIYFDMAFTPTIGMMNYEAQTFDRGNFDKSALTYGFDVTQLFFIHSNFAVRLDLKHRFYKEEILRYRGPGGVGTGDKVKDKNSDNTMLIIGGAVFF